MEYSDFLNVWQEIQRTIIFDDTWVMSSQWLHVSQPFPSMASWSYGDISFTFSLPVASPAIIVLSKYDVRYFKDIQGPCIWHLDFILAREGETEPLAESSYSFFYTRSVNVELNLEAGNYIVLARLDPKPVRDKDYFRKGLASGWDRRKLARILTERAMSQSIAANYKPNPQHLTTPVSNLLGGEQAKVNKTTTDALNTYGNVQPGQSITVTSTTTTTTVVSKNGGSNNDRDKPSSRVPPPHHFSAAPLNPYGVPLPTMEPWAGIPPSSLSLSRPPRYMDNYPPPPPLDLGGGGRPMTPPLLPPPPPPPQPSSPQMPIDDVLEEDNSIVIGLRVYTQKSAPTIISGKLKS